MKTYLVYKQSPDAESIFRVGFGLYSVLWLDFDFLQTEIFLYDKVYLFKRHYVPDAAVDLSYRFHGRVLRLVGFVIIVDVVDIRGGRGDDYQNRAL